MPRNLLNRVAILFLAFVLAAASAHAATPSVISYQGRILVSNAPFTGTGLFRFALVDSITTNIVWNSDSGGTTAPTTDISIPVANGLYSVLIGNTTATPANNYTMAALPATLFANNNPLSLRVYFNDGSNGMKQLAPDQVIAAVGYAMIAAPTGAAGGDLTGNYPAPTIASVGGVTAANVASGANAANAATPANTPNTIVSRDSSGSFTAFTAVFNYNGAGTGLTVLNPGGGSTIFAQGAASGVNAICTGTNGAAIIANNTGSSTQIAIFQKSSSNVAYINSGGAYVQSSDARLKTNIVPVTKALAKIQSMRGVIFDWKDPRRQPEQHDIGFIAQELLPIIPEAVTKGSDGYYSVAYSKVIPVLVEAVKELKKSGDAKIGSLESEVRTLKQQNADLEARLKRIETLLAK